MLGQTSLDWFDKLSTFGALAVILAVLLWWIYLAFRFLGDKLFAEPDATRNFPGGLVTRLVNGQVKMMATMEETIVKLADSAEHLDDKVENLIQAMGEVKSLMVRADSVVIQASPKGEGHDPLGGR